MSSAGPQNGIVRFGPFEANLSTQELLKFGTRLRVPNQSFQILALLLERPGQLVTREEFRQKLWPSDTFVEYDQGLNAAVNRLRDALGDSAEKPRYIETLPRRGYRFVGQAELVSNNHDDGQLASLRSSSLPAVASPVAAEPPSASHQPGESGEVSSKKIARKVRIAVPIALLFILAAAVAVVMLRERSGMPDFSSVKVTPFTSLPGQEISPSFSPDGSQVAFAWSSSLEQGFDLYVKTMGSERTISLTNHPAHWISPAWSPDGTQIAFSRWAQDGSGIFLISALGGPERKLTDASFWYEPFMQISWTADSKSLAYWTSA